MIALKNEYTGYLRSTDAKIRLLREVIGKVQRGEQVDVEKMLGRGNETVEREWDEGQFFPLRTSSFGRLSLSRRMLTWILYSAEGNRAERFVMASKARC